MIQGKQPFDLAAAHKALATFAAVAALGVVGEQGLHLVGDGRKVARALWAAARSNGCLPSIISREILG